MLVVCNFNLAKWLWVSFRTAMGFFFTADLSIGMHVMHYATHRSEEALQLYLWSSVTCKFLMSWGYIRRDMSHYFVIIIIKPQHLM